MMRSMKSQAELARAQRRERQVKYWLAWVPITSAILTSVYLLLDAISIVPML